MRYPLTSTVPYFFGVAGLAVLLRVPSRRAFVLACSARWRSERVKRSQNSEWVQTRIHTRTARTHNTEGGCCFLAAFALWVFI